MQDNHYKEKPNEELEEKEIKKDKQEEEYQLTREKFFTALEIVSKPDEENEE